MSAREQMDVVPVRVDDHVEMVGVTPDGNPDYNDFAGYDPSKEDVMKVWMSERGSNRPETPEDNLSYAELFTATQKHHDQLAGFGKSAIHGSWTEAGVHLPCDYSDPPVYRWGDGPRAFARAVFYLMSERKSMSLSKPLADLSALASIDPMLTGHDMYPLAKNRRYFDETQSETDD